MFSSCTFNGLIYYSVAEDPRAILQPSRAIQFPRIAFPRQGDVLFTHAVASGESGGHGSVRRQPSSADRVVGLQIQKLNAELKIYTRPE